jgi:23S rRNA (guanosine2251-2'-O)-methyltransferase
VYAHDIMQKHESDIIAIYGRHAVTEAVTHCPHAVLRVLYEAGRQDDTIKNAARAAGIPIDGFPAGQVPRSVPRDAVHQGFVALVDATKLTKPYDTYIETLEVTPDTAIVILGELQDPHNVGAVIRSAAAFGVKAVIIPEHRQAPLTGTVVKVSAGMAFRIPLVSVGNINQTLRDLKERGFWIYGLDGEAEHSVNDEAFEKPSVFILGNEGEGIRAKTLELCDIPLRIPTHPQTESLNASVSAAVVLAAWSKQHPKSICIS